MESSVTEVHELKTTLVEVVEIPGHEPRKVTATFARTRTLLISREQDRCFICGRTSKEVGQSHQAHHCCLEFCLADAVDWALVKLLCESGEWGFTQKQRDAAKAFPWSIFDPNKPADFVDNMLVNGLLLCPEHHIGKGTGIHMLSHPEWYAQRVLKDGYNFIRGDLMGSTGEREVEAQIDAEISRQQGSGSKA